MELILISTSSWITFGNVKSWPSNWSNRVKGKLLETVTFSAVIYNETFWSLSNLCIKEEHFPPLNILSSGTDKSRLTVYFLEIATVWPKIFHWNSYKYCDINLSDHNGFLSKSFIFLMFVSNDATCREYPGLLCILSSSTLCEPQLWLARKLLRQSGKVNGHWHSHTRRRAENNLGSKSGCCSEVVEVTCFEMKYHEYK